MHSLGLNRIFLLYLMLLQVRAALSSGSNSGIPPPSISLILSAGCASPHASQMTARLPARCSPAWLTPKWKWSSGRGRFMHARCIYNRFDLTLI